MQEQVLPLRFFSADEVFSFLRETARSKVSAIPVPDSSDILIVLTKKKTQLIQHQFFCTIKNQSPSFFLLQTSLQVPLKPQQEVKYCSAK
jgi:hypothetical protein